MAPAEAVWAARALAATHHASGGWSVGAVGLVAGWAARTMPADTTIAAVFPDGPQRYFDTIYNDDYCREHGLLDHLPRRAGRHRTPRRAGRAVLDRCATVVDPTGATQ